MITGGDLRQSRLDVGYKTFTISPWAQYSIPLGIIPDYRKNQALSVLLNLKIYTQHKMNLGKVRTSS